MSAINKVMIGFAILLVLALIGGTIPADNSDSPMVTWSQKSPEDWSKAEEKAAKDFFKWYSEQDKESLNP
jgi:hypothetical protein